MFLWIYVAGTFVDKILIVYKTKSRVIWVQVRFYIFIYNCYIEVLEVVVS